MRANMGEESGLDWLSYLLLLVLSFLVGLVGYLALSLWLTTPIYREVWEILQAAYIKIGVTFPFLAGLSLYLAWVIYLLVISEAGAFRFQRSPRFHLLLIENASPMLGFLGTLIGLAEAMSGLDTSKGIQTTVVWLTAKTGEAIYSSIYGAIQALIAYGVRFLFRLDGEGEKE